MTRLALTLALLAVSAPLAAQVTLTAGQPVQGTLARGDTARFRLDADSATLIRLTLDQRSVNATLRVLGPRGNTLRSVNAAPRGTERLQLETVTKGVHQVQVVPVDSASGAFTLTLVAREPLSSNPATLVDQLLAPWDRRDGPGAAVAVWRGGRTLLARGYGMANLAYDVPFTPTTPTNIGSTSKQFTAFAVMLLVDEGRLSLDDDVRTHFPELPDLGKVVTVRHLLTHTSGYREVYNALVIAARRIDEGDYVGREEMIGLLQRQPTLQNAPGAEFNYNNTAFALLAMLVERVAKVPFPEFMARRVFAPIGMTHTVVRADRHGTVRGATTGYSRGPQGDWRDLGDLGGSMGAGGIYTTLGDLQKWAENYASPRVGTAKGIAQMMTPFTLSTGKSTGYGFGLFIDRQGPQQRVHHGGADISHRSMLALYPDIDAGVTVQSNDGSFDSSIAFRIATAFFPELSARATTGAAFDAAAYDPKTFDRFVGRYALDLAPARIMTFTRTGDSLAIQLTGQPKFPIYPTSDTSFVLRVVPASVTFQRDAQGKVTGLMLHQNGDNHATRLEGPAPDAATPWVPTPAQLASYAGRYFSEELETFYEVAVTAGKLTVTNRRMEPLPLTVGAPDTFSSGETTLAFERDRNGIVVAFYAGNGRTRNVRFARVR
ncbi:MAG: serine hydrolase [Gemmatimonadaceae bacterium]|nr:serine hydrolase [Gemmatimonadaceae bacterium]